MKDLLKSLEARGKQPGFGYGLGTAENHVKRFLQSAGSDELRAAGVISEKDGVSAVKRGAGVATWMGKDDEVKKFTNASDFKQVLPEGMEAPKNTLIVMKHTLTTDREDRDSDILRTAGASLDPKAPLLWQHMHGMPIGGVLAQVSHTDNELKVVSAMLDLNDITSDAAKLVEANLLRFSHGFRIFDFEERKETESGWPGFDIKTFEIMEASLVSVPSNVDAEIEVIASQKFESKFFQNIQKSTLADRPVQVAGADLPLFKGVDDQPSITVKSNGKTISVKGSATVEVSDDIPEEPKAVEEETEKNETDEITIPEKSGNDEFVERLFEAIETLGVDENDEEKFLAFLEKFATFEEPADEAQTDPKSITIGYILSSSKEELADLKELIEGQIDVRSGDELAEQLEAL